MRIEEICFLDARLLDEISELDIGRIKETYFYAVGYVVRETDEFVCLSPTILPKSDEVDDTYYRRVMVIPKVSIKQRTVLKTEWNVK